MRWLFFLFFAGNAALFGWYQYQGNVQPPKAKAVTNSSPDIGLQLLTELAPDQQPSLREEPDQLPPQVASSSDAEPQQASDDAKAGELAQDAEPVPAQAEVSEEQQETTADAPDTATAAEVTQAAAADTTTAAASVPGGAAVADPNCYRIAGIRDQIALAPLAERVQEAGGKVTGKGSTDSATYRYWVMFPPFRSETAADAVVRELQRRRVRDFFLVRTGENRNGISLGVFSTAEAAKRRFDEILRLRVAGATPRIERVEAMSRRWWLTFSDSGGRKQALWTRTLQLKDGAELARESCR